MIPFLKRNPPAKTAPGPPRPGAWDAIMNRVSEAISGALHQRVKSPWRDQYNPLRSMTVARAITLIECGWRGDYAELQWTYGKIEELDPTLGALVDRRLAAIGKLDYDIKVIDPLPRGVSEAMAEAQRVSAEDLLSGIGNLRDAYKFLATATFRGFAHLEKQFSGDGDLVSLEPVEQWHWVRDGIYGEWQYNPDSRFGIVRGEEFPAERLVVREVRRPVNSVALVNYTRKGMGEKDWCGFVETFGIPALFAVLGENVPPQYYDEWLEKMQEIIGDYRGVLPPGSKIETPASEVRGTNPFKEFIDHWDEKLVLRGTGGKLTMLNDATGIGGSQGDVHADVFRELAEAEGAEISDLLNRELVDPHLDAEFPGETPAVYFCIASKEDRDPKDFAEMVVRIESTGRRVKDEQVSEVTGLQFEDREEEEAEEAKPTPDADDAEAEDEDPKPPADAEPEDEESDESKQIDDAEDAKKKAKGKPAPKLPKVKNRAESKKGEPDLYGNAISRALGVAPRALAPAADLLAEIEALAAGGADEAEIRAAVDRFAAAAPAYIADAGTAEDLADELYRAMRGAALAGVADATDQDA